MSWNIAPETDGYKYKRERIPALDRERGKKMRVWDKVGKEQSGVYERERQFTTEKHHD